MAQILFVTWAGGGNLAPALGIAGALARRGHRVRFLGHAFQEAAVRGGGFGFQAYGRSAPWPPSGPPDPSGPPPTFAVFTDAGIGADLVELCEREPADLVVIDHLLWGAHQAAQQRGLPHATLFHTLFGQQRDTWSAGPGWALARQFGYEPVSLWAGSRLILVATLAELDPVGPADAPGNAVFTGPVWQGRPVPASPPAEPRVLVSLSTVAQEGQAELLQRILDALAAARLRGLLTTGPSVDPGQLRAPAGVEVLRFAPHESVLPGVSLVISHGGHSTAMAALARDLPMLLMPLFLLGDQPVVAGALAARGAALALPKESGPGEIAEAVGRLLGDASHRAAAAELGALIRHRDGAEAAADALARLLAPSAAIGV